MVKLKEKFLKSPKTKFPSYSATKLVKRMGEEQGALVREVPEREVVQDNRSLFFDKELKKEKGWLLR